MHLLDSGVTKQINMPSILHRSVEKILLALTMALVFNTCAINPNGADIPSNTLAVYKTRFCLCCNGWIAHLNREGIKTTVINSGKMSEIKNQWGIPIGMQSCHTAVWDGKYVFEGHIPARYIRQYLNDPPKDSIGLTVPGMPPGSPGMYSGGDFTPYSIYLLYRDGSYKHYAQVQQPEKI